jgi:hypothetical protein
MPRKPWVHREAKDENKVTAARAGKRVTARRIDRLHSQCHNTMKDKRDG